MNTAVAGKPVAEPSVSVAHFSEQPLYLRTEERQLFGWLHQPSDSTRQDIGVVICSPFGFEAMCVHRSERAFAAALCERGIAVLRFDYAGTGDSADLPIDSDQIEMWTRDIVAASGELQRRTGVKQIGLLGIRLGALLAARAAARQPTVRALMTVAPIVSGRRYLREIELGNWHQNALASSGAAVPSGPQPYSEGSVESSGFVLTPASVTALTQIDLLKEPLAQTVTDALVIDRSDLPSARSWCEHLTQAGAQTHYLSLPDFAEMMKAPQFSIVPLGMIGEVCNWLAQLPGLSWKADLAREATPDERLGRIGQESLQITQGGARITESTLWLGSDRALFAVLAQPVGQESRACGVVLLNSGADHHIGPRRMNVVLARRWASEGYTVLRMDLGGLGDSGTRGGRTGNEVFPVDALQDLSAAVELLSQRYGVSEITVCGLCSGAYHALRSAVTGLAVNRVFMVNPLNLLPREAKKMDEMELAEIVSSARRYGKRAITLQSWRKALSGQIDYKRLIRVYAQRAQLTVGSFLQEIARRLRMHLPLDEDLGQQLLGAAARGVRMVFVFADGDSGIDLLKLQAGSALERLPDSALRTHIVQGADHDFTAVASRVLLEGMLTEELHAPLTTPPILGAPAISMTPPIKFAGSATVKR